MFWTNLVKTMAKILLVVMLIATFISFVSVVKYNAASGLFTLYAGIIGSVAAVSGIMMACEISENICAIKNHLTGNTETTEPINFNSIVQNLGVNLNNTAQSAPAQPAAPVQPSAPAEPAQTVTAQETTQSNPVDLSK